MWGAAAAHKLAVADTRTARMHNLKERFTTPSIPTGRERLNVPLPSTVLSNHKPATNKIFSAIPSVFIPPRSEERC
jgi:hypothetical protein